MSTRGDLILFFVLHPCYTQSYNRRLWPTSFLCNGLRFYSTFYFPQEIWFRIYLGKSSLTSTLYCCCFSFSLELTTGKSLYPYARPIIGLWWLLTLTILLYDILTHYYGMVLNVWKGYCKFLLFS